MLSTAFVCLLVNDWIQFTLKVFESEIESSWANLPLCPALFLSTTAKLEICYLYTGRLPNKGFKNWQSKSGSVVSLGWWDWEQTGKKGPGI